MFKSVKVANAIVSENLINLDEAMSNGMVRTVKSVKENKGEIKNRLLETAVVAGFKCATTALAPDSIIDKAATGLACLQAYKDLKTGKKVVEKALSYDDKEIEKEMERILKK